MMKKHPSKEIGQDISASTALFDLIQDPILLLTEDGESYRYLYANPAAIAIMPKQEIIGCLIEEVFLPEQSQTIIQQYKKVTAV